MTSRSDPTASPDPADAPTEVTVSRHLVLEGAFNFRHIGGYRTGEGGTVRADLLWRSDGLHRLTDADLDRLAELGLRTVLDLRTAGELESGGRTAWPPPAPAVHHLPLMDVLPEHDDYAASWTRPEHVAAQYLSMLDSGRGALTAALEILAEADSYPAVVHCMAGKDRTGIVVAVVLGMLGVGADDIIADYALSAAGMQRLLGRLTVELPEQAEKLASGAAAMVGAEPATMARFLDAITERYGSWDSLASALGQPDLPVRLRRVLVRDP